MNLVRGVAIACILVVTVCVLYLPSAHPPEHFLERLQAEHELSVQLWGQDHAFRILARMLRLQESAKDASPVSNAVASSTQPANLLANPALGLEVSKVMTAFYQNQYFKSIEALFALAAYRCAQLAEWLSVFGVFVFAVLFDGYVRRIVKSKEFLHHNPEVFGVHLCLIIILLGAVMVAFVLPVTIPPIVWAVVPFCIAIFGGFAIANFHYRG